MQLVTSLAQWLDLQFLCRFLWEEGLHSQKWHLDFPCLLSSLLLLCNLLLDLQKILPYSSVTLFSPAWGQKDCFCTLNNFLIHLSAFFFCSSSHSSYIPDYLSCLCAETYFLYFSRLGCFGVFFPVMCILCQQYSCYQNVLLCSYLSILWRTIKCFILYHTVAFFNNNVQRWSKSKLTYKGNKVDVNWGKNGGDKSSRLKWRVSLSLRSYLNDMSRGSERSRVLKGVRKPSSNGII